MPVFLILLVTMLETFATATPMLFAREALAATKPYQLRGVQSPIYHLYLQSLASDKTGKLFFSPSFPPILKS